MPCCRWTREHGQIPYSARRWGGDARSPRVRARAQHTSEEEYSEIVAETPESIKRRLIRFLAPER